MRGKDITLVIPPFCNFVTVKVSFDGDPLHINSRRRATLMVKRILRRRDVSGNLRDDAGKGVSRAMEVEALDASLLGILLQVL